MPRVAFIASGIAALVALAAPVGAVTKEEHFKLQSGADLVALCSTATSDRLYPAAIHMCHGFGAGVYQTIQALTSHEKLQPVMCPPSPPPSRNEGIKLFLEWAKRNQDRLAERPADVLGRFLVEQFPCRK
jgi:hypothetical protein